MHRILPIKNILHWMDFVISYLGFIFFLIPPPPRHSLSPLGVHKFVLYICVSISALQTRSSVPFF